MVDKARPPTPPPPRRASTSAFSGGIVVRGPAESLSDYGSENPYTDVSSFAALNRLIAKRMGEVKGSHGL